MPQPVLNARALKCTIVLDPAPDGKKAIRTIEALWKALGTITECVSPQQKLVPPLWLFSVRVEAL